MGTQEKIMEEFWHKSKIQILKLKENELNKKVIWILVLKGGKRKCYQKVCCKVMISAKKVHSSSDPENFARGS